MAPKIIHRGHGDILIPKGDTTTVAAGEALLAVPGMPGTLLLWNGHEFELGDFYVAGEYWQNKNSWLVEVTPRDPDTMRRPVETLMHIYYPVDPRTNETDWKGANRAYANETNDAWLPAHDDADHMRDREVELRAGLVAVLQPEIDKLVQSVLTASDSKPSNWPLGIPWETRQTRRVKLDDILRFRDAAIECLLEEARERHIGWYHQHPHLSHLHDLVHDCITTTLRAEGNPYSRVFTEIRRAAVSLAPHAYETRWDREARLEAEAKAKEAAAESASDDGNGDGAAGS